jgi:response regulator RpfG family c-di-GMP phosphodiesterase
VPTPRPRVLCVDDEPLLLDCLVRVLRAEFAVVPALGGRAGVEALQSQGPFVAMVTDLRMPEIDGLKVLKCAQALAPSTLRLLLTGNADLDVALTAVNDGQVFRLLTKPCRPEAIVRALHDAAEQYRLQASERVLLERTVHGSVTMLTELLALTHPTTFARLARVKRRLRELCERLGVRPRWHIEVAAMLSQVGAVTLPPEVAARYYGEEPLGDEERQMIERLPSFTDGLLAGIPRLEPVREILTYSEQHFDGSGSPVDEVRGTALPLGARLLKLLLDLEKLQANRRPVVEALATLNDRPGWYDPELLAVLTDLITTSRYRTIQRDLPLEEVRSGMVLLEDVRAASGVLLVASGQEMTDSLTQRVRNFRQQLRAINQVRVALKDEDAEEALT